MRKISVIVLIAAAFFVGSLTLTSASATDGSSSFRLVAVTTQQASIDVGTKGTSLGDQDVFHDKVFANKRLVGSNDGVCTITALDPKAKTGTQQCLVTSTLPGGTLTVQGVIHVSNNTPQPASLAITGGTGRYVGASGQADLTFSEKFVTIDVELVH